MKKLPIQLKLIVLCPLVFFMVQLNAQVSYGENLKGSEYNIGYTLKWSTLNENNCKSFVIERSFDGQKYEIVTSLDAKGQEGEETHYLFNDQELGLKKAFYRLKEVTFDGTTSLSEPIVMNKTHNSNFTIAMIADKTTSGIFEITINSIVEEDLVCFVNNDYGDIILKEKRALVYGLNELVFDLQNEEEGNYNFIFKVGREMETLGVSKKEDESKKRNMANHKNGNGGG